MTAIFRSGTQPHGYTGGTGCVDSCAPSIELLGPVQTIYTVANSRGLRDYAPDTDPESLNETNASALARWDAEIQQRRPGFDHEVALLTDLAGGERLCDAAFRPCARVWDDLPGNAGKVALPAEQLNVGPAER